MFRMNKLLYNTNIIYTLHQQNGPSRFIELNEKTGKHGEPSSV